MMRIADRDMGYVKLRNAISEAKTAKVTVGIHGTAGSDAVVIASTHEFGSTIRKIPKRSFLRSAMDENRTQYKELVTKMLGKIVDLKLTTHRALELLGMKIQADVVNKINSNIPPANAPKTIEAKGSSITLIDTGAMKQSVTYVVKE